MKAKYTYITICVVLMTLVACHKEEVYTGPCDVRFRAYLQDEVSVTRTSYTEIGDTVPPPFTAELFVSNGEFVNASTLVWNGATVEAALRLEADEYYVYGYVPWTDAAEFDPTTHMMTVPGIPGFGDTDAMVIKPQPLTIAQNDKTKEVTLQMDHLLARVTPCFYVHDKYVAMRTIKIKKVEMIMPNDTLYTALVNVGDNVNYSVEWNVGGVTTDTIVTTYETATPDTLTAKRGEQEYGSCYLCPEKMTEGLRLRVTYDVYDKADPAVLTRADAVVENRIKRLPAFLTAGTNYRLHVKIVPTYLYALSDNDNGTEILIVDKN